MIYSVTVYYKSGLINTIGMLSSGFPDLPSIEYDSDSDMDIDGDSYLEELLEKLFVPRVPETPTEETCCICMENFDGTRNTTLKCGHQFHTDCILQNIATASSNKCPLCRDEMCKEISATKVKELEKQLVALENTLDCKDKQYSYVKKTMMYFHEILELQDEDIDILELSKKTLLKENHSVWKALERSQVKLSTAAELNPKSYKKCGYCKMFGHNIKMCAKRKYNDEGYHKNYAEKEKRVITSRAPRSSVEEIMNSILPGGDLYDSVDEWFEWFE